VELRHGDGATMMHALGFAFDIAMTRAAYERAVCPSHGVFPLSQDKSKRLWDVLWTLRAALKDASEGITAMPFQLWVSQVAGTGLKMELLALKAVWSLDDNGGAVITIMLSGEDETSAACPPA
jgi:hypothetical protein